ncbi:MULTISPECIES: SemiSWEET transporter [Thermodesulfovibrio]|uniref:SemiSWEET transporter n=1 Tax=Thermodesulfovibrio TaxID=28261 RepID=UPI0026016339|nr:SemiSWEET transporter [Thermodesulfovibrio sp.]
MELATKISNLVGIIAGIITTSALLPQAIKIYRTKSARDISLAMFIFLAVGVTLWLIYGILIKEVPVIAANFFSLLLIMAIIAMKIRYR